MLRALLIMALLASGCREIRVLPAEAGGGTTSTGGPQVGVGGVFPSGGGGSGAGGSGGEAPVPAPVPGCEQLVSAGEPVDIVFPLQAGAAHVRIAALSGERAGLTYNSVPGASGTIWSHTVNGPFDSWPPTVAEPVETELVVNIFESYPGPLETSVDGVYGLNGGVPGFFSFDAPGVVRAFEQGWREGFPRLQSSEGALIVSSETSTNPDILSSLATFSSAPIPIAEFPDEACRTTRVVHEADGGAFISRGVAWCEAAPRADFYRLQGDQLTSLGGFVLPFLPHKQFLTPREGGYFYAVSNYAEGIVVYSLDLFGSMVQEPWIDTYTAGDAPIMFQRWRDGFVISRVAFTTGTVSLIASDGTNQTASTPFNVEIGSSNGAVAILVGGVDDGSILFAYPQYDQSAAGPKIGLFRADCLTDD